MKFIIPRKGKNTGLFVISFLVFAMALIREQPWDALFFTMMVLATFYNSAYAAYWDLRNLLSALFLGLLMGIISVITMLLFPQETRSILHVFGALNFSAALWTIYWKRMYEIHRHPFATIAGLCAAGVFAGIVMVNSQGRAPVWITAIAAFIPFLVVMLLAQKEEVLVITKEEALRLTSGKEEKALLDRIMEDVRRIIGGDNDKR